MGYITEDKRKVTTQRLREMKQRGEKIAMLTAYDYTMAKMVDGAGIDVILVGDSASNVMAGNQGVPHRRPLWTWSRAVYIIVVHGLLART